MESRIKHHTRLRPGEQKRHQLPATLGAYDLAKDRRIRAELALLGGSLGAACRRHHGAGHQEASGCRSFIARDELYLVSNDQLSDKELNLVAQVIDFGEGNCELRRAFPASLYASIREAAFSVMQDEFHRARRARVTGNTLKYLRAMEELPKRRQLVVDSDLRGCIL